jgi:hypothetical protein
LDSQSQAICKQAPHDPATGQFIEWDRPQRKCSVSNCGNSHHANGLCKTHATAHRRLMKSAQDEHRAESRIYSHTVRGRFSRLKSNARTRSLACTLTLEQYSELISHSCHYCGGELPKTGGGLDRKDSQIGYTFNNCVPCCEYHNRLKGEHLTYEEMLLICAHRKSKGVR